MPCASSALARRPNQPTRHDFSNYKPNTLNRRIERRIAIHALETPALYAQFLHNNSQETDLLF
jgi:chemotaxis methyl-accepting protein methylase